MPKVERNPCIHCGLRPVMKLVGTMIMIRCHIRCHKRPRGCGQFVYAETMHEAHDRWQAANPAPSLPPHVGGDRAAQQVDGDTTGPQVKR